MLTADDLARLKRAITEAAKHAWTDDTRLEEHLFPYWQTAVHEILQHHGCACGTPECMLACTPETQRTLPLGDLAFPTFVASFREGRDLFQQELTQRGAKA